MRTLNERSGVPHGHPAADVLLSPTLAAQRIRWPLAEAVAILDGKAAHVCEPAGHRDHCHAFLRLGAQQCIPDLGESCVTQVAHGRRAREVAEMLEAENTRKFFLASAAT